MEASGHKPSEKSWRRPGEHGKLASRCGERKKHSLPALAHGAVGQERVHENHGQLHLFINIQILSFLERCLDGVISCAVASGVSLFTQGRVL